MSDFQNQIVGIVGRKGSGKSTRARVLLKYAPRILAWDPMADYVDLLPDQFEGVDDGLEEYFAEVRQRRLQRFACAVVPDDLEPEFEVVCQLALNHGPMLLAIEEAPLVCRANYLPPVFGKIVRTGRHRGLDLLWTAQRAGEVSRSLTSATDVFIFFSQTEPRDLDAIAERCGRQVAERVAGLGLHDHFTWNVMERQVTAVSPRLLKRDSAESSNPPVCESAKPSTFTS